MAAPVGRFHLAFNQPTLTWAPTWTRIDAYANLVTSYTIDRGRQYELDRTDTGRAVVSIADRDGILDPTNPGGPFYGLIDPRVGALICRRNPVTDTWHERFRGHVEDWDYVFDPSGKVNRLEVSLVDIFDMFAAYEMYPDKFGEAPPVELDAADQVYYPPQTMKERIDEILLNAIGPTRPLDWTVVFTGNVSVQASIYQPGESALSAIQEAADAEFPGVSNVYTDRYGRLAVHGRLAKFDPAGVLAGVAPGDWDWHRWKAGDGAAVSSDPANYAHLRRFAFNRGQAKIINQAVATPLARAPEDRLTGPQLIGQIATDDLSIAQYGICPWSAQDLLTLEGLLDGSTALQETRRFADYYVANYAWPQDRVREIGFRSMHPDAAGSSELWRLLSLVDISDEVTVTIQSPGGGFFANEPFYVEGVHEEVRPLTPDYDDVTLTLDLSPQAYFATNPFPTA